MINDRGTVHGVQGMIIDRGTVRCHRVLGPVLLAAGICLFGGCGSMSGPLGSARTPLAGLGPKEGTEAFKKRVHNDRFPTAAQALAENSLRAAGG